MVELNICFKCPALAEKKAIYIINLMSSITSIKFKKVDSGADITYGGDNNQPGFTVPYIEYEIKNSDWLLFNDRTRLVLPGFIQPESAKVKDLRLGLDIFALIWKFLETGLGDKKQSKWLPEKIKTKLKYIYPFFISYVDFFVKSLKSAGLLPDSFQKVSPWPNGAPFAIGVSHDLDIHRRKIPGGLKMLAMAVFSDSIPGGVTGSLRGLSHSMISAVTFVKNPYCTFDKWFEIEPEGTNFIFAGKRHSSLDPTYKVKKVARDLSGADKSKFEIALHNGIGTWSDSDGLSRKRSDLAGLFEADIKGIRPHYLDFQLPDFWRNIRGFSYSSTLGSDTIPGFTCGLNFPLFGFDFNTGETFDVLEMPIGLMDCSLFTIKDKTLRDRTLNEIINITASSQGLLVLDWHVRTAYTPDFPGWFDTYLSILEKAKSAGAYIAPLGAIDTYWRKHCESVFLS